MALTTRFVFGALIERSGAKPEDCAVAFGLDPFAAVARGPFPADWSAQATRHVETALEIRGRGFRGPLLVADARAVHAAGGSPAQELAFALAAAVSLLRLLEAAGTTPAEAREMVAFRLAADADELATLSKFRALRILWSRVEEACGLEPRAAHVQAESAWRMMTARDPYVNVMRGAAAAFSAGLGGADSVSVLPHTLAAGLPDSLARRIARNAQLILLRESNLGFVADPAAGAGAFEALTQALCDKAWGLFQEIEGRDGLPATLANGAFQRKVAHSAAALVHDVARLKTLITGVSAHADLAERPVEVAIGAPEREPLVSAEGGLAPIRLAEPFERLRDLSDAFFQRSGARPKVYLAALGPESRHRRRVQFAREWLAAGGFEAIYDGEATTTEEAVKRMRAAGAPLVCLCGDRRRVRATGRSLCESAQGFRREGRRACGPAGRIRAGMARRGRRRFHFRRAGCDRRAARPLSPHRR